MFRIILLGALMYFAIKAVNRFLIGLSKPVDEVKGTSKQKSSIDLNQDDIEDADFRDIKDDD